MVDDAIVFDVSIEASYHNLKKQLSHDSGAVETPKGLKMRFKLTQPFLQGQLPNLFRDRWQTRLLDTPDHFDYDSACTMILNLARTRVMRMGSAEALRLFFDNLNSAASEPLQARNG